MLIYFIFISLDIDECSADPSPCHENADCSNSKGSYSCTCSIGFTGDGKSCQGIFIPSIAYVCGVTGLKRKATRTLLSRCYTKTIVERLEKTSKKSTIFLHMEISTRVRCMDGCEVGTTLYCMNDIIANDVMEDKFFLFQISTSALQSPLRVMKTLDARTVTARSVACVTKGSPETEKHVKVLHKLFRLALQYLVKSGARNW